MRLSRTCGSSGVQQRRLRAEGEPAIRLWTADDVHLRLRRCGQGDGLHDQFGWGTEDMGALEAARAIKPLCMSWCIPGVARGDCSPHAFKLLR